MSLTERFYCRPSDLFESLTDERRIRAYTQVNSQLAYGFVSVFGGCQYVAGIGCVPTS